MPSLAVTNIEHVSTLRAKPIITIITAVFNGAASFDKTVRSISMQLCDEVEYIVIDGASTDGTLDIIKRHQDVISSWISEPDMGIYDAWNKGIGISRGDYISFVGADDFIKDGYVSTYLDAIKRQPNIDYWSSRVVLNSKPPRIIGKCWNWFVFRRYMSVAHVGSLHSKRLYEKYGHYDISFRIAGDYEFLLRPGRTLSAGYIDKTTVVMGAGGVSNKEAFCALAETRKAKLLHGVCNKYLVFIDEFIAYAKLLARKLKK